MVSNIVQASRDVDLMIMGASEQRIFEQWMFGSIPEQVMQHMSVTLILDSRGH